MLLIFIIVILAILCILFATETISFKSHSDTNTKSTRDNATKSASLKNNFSSVAGTYTAKFENLKGDGDETSASITLTLHENGVFTYVFSQYTPSGVLGNYTIDDDKIILTNWFNSYSSTDLQITKGTKTLTINSDGSITDSNIKNKSLVNNDIISANLIKGYTKSQLYLSNRLGAAFFTGSDRTISEPAM